MQFSNHLTLRIANLNCTSQSRSLRVTWATRSPKTTMTSSSMLIWWWILMTPMPPNYRLYQREDPSPMALCRTRVLKTMSSMRQLISWKLRACRTRKVSSTLAFLTLTNRKCLISRWLRGVKRSLRRAPSRSSCLSRTLKISIVSTRKPTIGTSCWLRASISSRWKTCCVGTLSMQIRRWVQTTPTLKISKTMW